MSWLPWSSPPPSKPSLPPPSISSNPGPLDLEAAWTRLVSLPPETLFAAGALTALLAGDFYRRFFKRIPNSEWVTPNLLHKKRWIRGYVTSVGDADNFRLYHTPGIGWRWPLKLRHIPKTAKELKDRTIHIRLAGVDAPEASHFGRPAQPYADDALQWLKSTVEGKFVYCQLIRKDQYARIVAVPHLSPWFLPSSLFTGKPVALDMLRAGWVEVYEQSGAEYGKWGKEALMKLQAEAQRNNKGMWAKGTGAESPSAYKKRYRDAASGKDIDVEAQVEAVEKRSILSRIFGK